MTRRPGPFADLLLLPREVWVLCLSALVNRAGTMVLPFLVLYLTRDLGFSAERAGGVLALFGLVSVGGAPLGGWLADRFGSLPVMKASLLLSALFLFAYPASTINPSRPTRRNKGSRPHPCPSGKICFTTSALLKNNR